MPLLIIIVIPLLLIFLSAKFIARKLYKYLVKSNNKYAMALSITCFIVVAALIAATLFLIVITNISFSRGGEHRIR
jgi:hypothetical protein